MPDTTRVVMRDRFQDFRQGGMSVQAYAKCFIELVLFALEDVTTDALRVGRFKRNLHDKVKLVCDEAD